MIAQIPASLLETAKRQHSLGTWVASRLLGQGVRPAPRARFDLKCATGDELVRNDSTLLNSNATNCSVRCNSYASRGASSCGMARRCHGYLDGMVQGAFISNEVSEETVAS